MVVAFSPWTRPEGENGLAVKINGTLTARHSSVRVYEVIYMLEYDLPSQFPQNTASDGKRVGKVRRESSVSNATWRNEVLPDFSTHKER
jgi:hypothetical protein